VPDATRPCTTGCEGDADAGEGLDGSMPVDAPATFDAPDAPDAPGDGALNPTDNEACRVDWPQAAGFYTDPADMHVAVDAMGNTFVTMGYGNGPEAADDAAPPVFGVTLPGDPEGFVVAKIDSGCHLVWMNEYGFPHVAEASLSIQGLGLDALSNVTVMGTFSGSIDLGAGIVDALPVIEDDAGNGRITADTFLLRLDAAGGLLFSSVLHASDGLVVGSSLAVAPDGVSTLLAAGSNGADFGTGPVDAGGPPGPIADLYVAQFSLLGVPTHVEVRTPSEPTYQTIVADPTDGLLWALGPVPDDGGWTPSLIRLDSTAGFAWSRAIDPSAGFGVGASGEVVFQVATSHGLPGDETLTFYDRDGGQTPSRTTPGAYLGQTVSDHLVLSPSGDVFVGGTFEGTPATDADGSFTQIPSPVGAGFQRFDSSGVLRSVSATGGTHARLGAMGLAPDGNVVMLGVVQDSDITAPPPSLFVVKIVP
jgi:hypothetical protein